MIRKAGIHPRASGARGVAWAAALVFAMLASCARRTSEPEPPPPTPEPAEAAIERPDTAEVPGPADTIPEPPAVPEAAGLRPIRICAGGDVMLGNNLDTLWAGRASTRIGRPVPPFPDPDSLLAPLRSLVDDADIVLLNIEGAIGEGDAPGKCRPGSTRCYAFRQPVGVAAALKRFAEPARVVGNVANNHAMDAGPEGLRATIEHLSAAGVRVTGSDTLATPVVTSSGDTIGVLGFAVFRAGPDARDLSAVRRHVARAVARYRRVVVTMHMGAEGQEAQRTPDAVETFAGEDRGNSVAFARTAVGAGASLVVGHGPHVLRAAQWQGDALILYSLGNLLTYGPFNMREPNDRGAIACALLDLEGRVTQAELRPTRQRPPGLVSPDPTERGLQLVDSLSRLDFPETGARVRPDGALLRPRSGR